MKIVKLYNSTTGGTIRSGILHLPVLSLLLVVSISSCKKFVDVDLPRNLLSTQAAFASDAEATSVLLGIYGTMANANSGFISGSSSGLAYLSALSADELANFSVFNEPFAYNALDPNLYALSGFWNEPYSYIYTANSVIEGLATSTKVSAATKKQLEGEAKFVRAFCYFYLVNFFGDVPLHLTTDYRANSVAVRSSQENIYQQIVADLKDAQTLLGDEYVTEGRVRPNKAAATALLARTYLYQGDWANAEVQATTIIENTATYNLVNNLDSVFLSTSSEAIWQLMPVDAGYNANEPRFFILNSSPVDNSGVALSASLLNAFENNDKRKIHWINNFTDGTGTWYYPFKYKIAESGLEVTEYSMVLRLTELYLIRAEARAHQEDIDGAQADLDAIRNRAGLNNTTANDQAALLLAIEHERQVELFTEGGHRWLDLKRTGRADAVLGSLKASNWQNTDTLYPIPQSEIKSNPRITQNDGYGH